MKAATHVQLAAAVLERGQADEALEHCFAAVALTQPSKLRGALDLDLFVTLVRALKIQDQPEAAQQAAARGRALMTKRASKIDDPNVRHAYEQCTWAAALAQ